MIIGIDFAKGVVIVEDIDYAKLRRGFILFEVDDITYAWPRCEITDCPNHICVRMSKSLCYPHGIEFGAFTKEEFEANRKANRKKK